MEKILLRVVTPSLKLFVALTMLFAWQTVDCQIITNGSFEAPNGSSSSVPPNWQNCGGSPDVQIISGTGQGIFGINTPPDDGNTYMGMVTTNNQSYQEAMGQPVTLVAGTNYSGSIALYYSNLHTSWNGNGRLQIWGGTSCNARNELLFDSGTITNLHVWNNFPISFTPSQNHSFIIMVNRMNNGTGSMDYFCMDDFELNNILPIELSAFTGEGVDEMVQLNWETAPSLQGQQFEILWSNDPDQTNAFENIGQVEAEVGQGSFDFLHARATPGANFYRLKMIDENGAASFSEVLKVDLQKAHLVDVYPNPSEGRLNVSAMFFESGSLQLQLVDLQGRTVYEMAETRNSGLQTLDLDLRAEVVPGIYNLRVTLDGRTEFRKVVIH